MRAVAAVLLVLVAASCAPRVAEDRIALARATFNELPGWRTDDPRDALKALLRSCHTHLGRASDRPVGPLAIAGRAGDWKPVCTDLLALDPAGMDAQAARAFIENRFVPFGTIGENGEDGLFTGYYEASARGARARSARYKVPVYRRPDDLVSVDLGRFDSDFRGRTIAGRVNGGRLVPYADRRAINRGHLAGRGLEILWLDDPVDAFFLEIQGSGRVTLDDGTVLRVGFAAKNGRPYTAIGRVLVDVGAMPPEQVSMQSIRAWLAANPGKARVVMERNRAFVFFRVLEGDGPIGAEGVALTPERSLAVDRRFLAMGVPMFIAAAPEAGTAAEGLAPVRRLMVAQDTGGAIRGAVRGDIFLGWGEDAAARAGRMRLRGRAWILLPRAAAARRRES